MKKHSYTPWILRSLWTVRILIFITLGLLFFDFRFPYEVRVPSEKGNNIVLVLDISRSMMTDDISPSRIEKAKSLLVNLLSKESPDRFGYIIFAGKPFALSPLTQDKGGLANMIQSTTTESIAQGLPDTSGTNIGDAILSANMLLSGATGDRAIVLLTDGRANIGIDPVISAEESRTLANPIYPIGIGSSSGALLSYLDGNGVRQYFYDVKNEPMKADIDEQTLQKIASISGGRYIHASDALSFEQGIEEIGKTVGSEKIFQNEKRMVPMNPIFYGLILLLGIIHLFLARRLRKYYKMYE